MTTTQPFGTLLVYGTLRPGGEQSITLSGYRMYDLGWYPGIVHTGNDEDTIVCERIEVQNQSHLDDLDRYEGCDGNTKTCLYHRVKEGGDWLYVYNGYLHNRIVVPDGDWLAYTGHDEGSNSQLTEHEEA